MNVSLEYARAVASGEIEDCPRQREVVAAMDDLTVQLSLGKRWTLPLARKKTATGIYLYGEVGAGKTFLMDLFYRALPVAKKKRIHFHKFMQQIDAQLRALQGEKDPLRRIAKNMARTTTILCLDEFLVLDVACAMILAELLDAFFDQGMVLVMTSNTRPDELYRNGVQRERFLPAIALIKKHCQVIQLQSERDYRLGRSVHLNTFLSPVNLENHALFAKQFELLEPKAQRDSSIMIQNRSIPFICRGSQAIWFEFSTLCHMPRSQLDYLELSEYFSTFFLSSVPVFDRSDSIEEFLFTQLIDVLYDRNIQLLMLASAPLSQLADSSKTSKAFARTMSRLQEMQSNDYLLKSAKKRKTT